MRGKRGRLKFYQCEGDMARQGRRVSKARDRAKGVESIITEEDFKEYSKYGYQQEQENHDTFGGEGDFFITFGGSEEGSFNNFGGSKLDKLGKPAWETNQTRSKTNPIQ